MTNGGKAHKTSEQNVVPEKKQAATPPEIDRLISLAEEMSGGAQTGGEAAGRPAAGRRFSAAQAARCASEELEHLTRLKIDNVSAVSRVDSGWEVVVNMIELSRIPHSTDVLASYNVLLDAEGQLENYRRMTRYLRDQTGEDL